jgi:Tfp pilus assembly protein PilZ
MESQYLINSIAIGGSFFVGVILFWFIFVYLKKRLTPDKPIQSLSAAISFPVENKRQHPRVEVSWEAKAENSEISQDVVLKDISIGGAFVVCQEPAAMQDQLKIIINLPNSETLQLNAEVVWSNANMPLDKVVNRGMGIRFIQNEDSERQKLQDAIDDATLEKSSESV